MLFRLNTESRLEALEARLHAASLPSRELIDDVLEACEHDRLVGATRHRLGRLVAAGAWTEAALALVTVALPGWTVRRLVCDGGEWICSLSRQPNLPEGLDDAVDASHETLSLAILLCGVTARHRILAMQRRAARHVPLVGRTAPEGVCCENFS